MADLARHAISKLAIGAASLLAIALPVQSEAKRPELGYCSTDIRQGWHFYCDPDAQAPEDEEVPAVVPPAPPPAAAPPKPQTATERMEAFNVRINELKHLAILDPTPDNLHNYMTAQAVAMRMASTFADQWQRVLFKTPELDANIRNPVSGLGGRVYQDIRVAEQETALKDAAANYGLMFVFQEEIGCAVCPAQSQILGHMAATYDVEILPVTMDGSATPEFANPMQESGQLANLGLDQLPRPNLSLVDPSSGEVVIIGSGLLTQDVILSRIHKLTTTAPGKAYSGENYLRDHAGFNAGGVPQSATAPVLPPNPLLPQFVNGETTK